MNRNKLKSLTVLITALTVAAFVATTCDMTDIFSAGINLPDENNPTKSPSSGGREISAQERDELEKTGHFLKLTYMPHNTQISNVFSVNVANSVSAIAKLDGNESVQIFRETTSAAVYLPLAYNDDSKFTENGSFYVAFTIHVDAITSYVLALTDKVLVSFIDGRGELDVRTLPYQGPTLSDHRYLTIFNLPPYLLSQNVSKVFIHNQTGPIALCEDYSLIDVSAFSSSSTVRIPLSFNGPSSGSAFSGTGNFYVTFELFIDALTHYTVTIEDRVIVPFINGNGAIDINDLPIAATTDRRYLTIYNLPPELLARNISNVIIYNQAGPVARCENYDLMEISVSDNKSSIRIPLSFTSPPSTFTGTGSFIVAFDINIDAVTRFNITVDDEIMIFFMNGNGYLDVENLPEKPIPYLTIKGLPINTLKNHFSNVGIYNMVGQVASCNDNNKILMSYNDSYATALIPISYSSDNYFLETGFFNVTFTVNVDAYTRISFNLNDGITLYFTGGSAIYDMAEGFGFFSGSLVNPFDTDPPVIKKNTSFELDNLIHYVQSDTSIDLVTPSKTCILYIYAYQVNNNLFFEYSTVMPSFVAGKNGYYSGSKRALWKMLFIKNTYVDDSVIPAPADSTDKFISKIPVADNFSAFEYFTISNTNTAMDGSFPVQYHLSGSNNPLPTTFGLSYGIYAIKLDGGGGGGGFGTIRDSAIHSNSSSSGGNGGSICEIIIIPQTIVFTAYTGSGGDAAPIPTPTGGFLLLALPNISSILYTHKSCGRISGGGGGGGGAGTCIYNEESLYLLCAGGGGGGGGGSLISPGGGGGAGGSIGPGAGGGAGGYEQQIYQAQISATIFGAHGGDGGGHYAGSGGLCDNASPRSALNGSDTSSFYQNYPFANNQFFQPGLFYDYNGVNTNSYDWASFYHYVPCTTSTASGLGGKAPKIALNPDTDWRNTHDSNGKGGDANALTAPIHYSDVFILSFYDSTNSDKFYPQSVKGKNGQDGGSNRNSLRGGGPDGGYPDDNGRPTNGSPGSITIYKIY